MTIKRVLSRCERLTTAVNGPDDVDTDELDDLAATMLRLAPAWNSEQLAAAISAFSTLIDAVTARRDAMQLQIKTTATGSKAVRGYGRPSRRLYTGQRVCREI